MWRALCGKAVAICGQAVFRSEAAILKRLVTRFGPDETERMLDGAKGLGWRSLKGLGSKDGLGRRWAVEAYWRAQNAERKVKMPTRMKAILWEIANED